MRKEWGILLVVGLVCALGATKNYYDRRLRRLDNELASLREQVTYLVNKRSQGQDVLSPAEPVSSMDRALEQLGSSDLIKQYQAGMLLRKKGDEAVEPLADLVRHGSSRQRESALLMLAAIDSSNSTAAIRELAKSSLTEGDEERTVAMLAVLGSRGDQHAKPLFREALEQEALSVRLAGVSGLRALQDFESLPLLLEAFADDDPLVRKEVARCIKGLARDEPKSFQEKMEQLPPKSRFQLVQVCIDDLSGKPPGPLLEELARDDDPRVAAAAERAKTLIAQKSPASDARTKEHPSTQDHWIQEIQNLVNR